MASGRYLGVVCGGATVITAAMLVGIVLGSNRHTYAAYSDYADAHAAAVAGTWTPDPPAACGDISKYSKIIYGTDGDDSITGTAGADRIVDLKHGGNRDIIMGLGGNDDLSGVSGKDCIVGGSGNDTLRGDNGKDILLGGDGDDQLFGSNGPDLLDGGPGNDLCVGGRAPSAVTNCEHVAMQSVRTNAPVRSTQPGSTAPSTPDTETSTSSSASTFAPSSAAPPSVEPSSVEPSSVEPSSVEPSSSALATSSPTPIASAGR